LKKAFDDANANGGVALKALIDEYAGPLLRVIRARLRRNNLRSQYDSADFLQRTRVKLEQCDLASKHFETADQFLAYMIRVAQNEIGQAARKQHVPERSLDGLTAAEQQQMTAHDPQPDDIAVADEMWRNALAKLDRSHRGIAWMLRDEYMEVEIAKKLGISDRTVRRVLKKLQEILKTVTK
jgi:RNA polymerase sigma factor (sigma-70 family)